MFKTIITAVVLVTVAVSAQAKTKMFEGSGWSFTNSDKVHTETVNLLSNTKVHVLDNGENYFLVLEGRITNGMTNKVESMILELKAANKGRGHTYALDVYLHSNGGDASEGIKLGKMFRKNRISARVAGDMVCWSACSDAFIGGKWRTITGEGKVVVHAPYTTGKYGTSTCVKSTDAAAKPFVDYAKSMLPISAANKYNYESFKCDVNGGYEFLQGDTTIQN